MIRELNLDAKSQGHRFSVADCGFEPPGPDSGEGGVVKIFARRTGYSQGLSLALNVNDQPQEDRGVTILYCRGRHWIGSGKRGGFGWTHGTAAHLQSTCGWREQSSVWGGRWRKIYHLHL